jgi:hypothetical protein
MDGRARLGSIGCGCGRVAENKRLPSAEIGFVFAIRIVWVSAIREIEVAAWRERTRRREPVTVGSNTDDEKPQQVHAFRTNRGGNGVTPDSCEATMDRKELRAQRVIANGAVLGSGQTAAPDLI